MLKIYDADHNAVGTLRGDKETKETFVLKDSDATLDFQYPYMGRYAEYIACENYIQTEHAEYVIKSVKEGDEYVTVCAQQNIEELESDIESYTCKRKGLDVAAEEVLDGTGWTVAYCDITRKRSISKTYCSIWDVIKQMKSTYTAECVVDSINKTLSFYEQYGSDKGAYFIEGLNLRKAEAELSTYDFYTQIYPIGKNGLTVADINAGSPILSNFQFSKKRKLLIWKDERYAVIEDLLEDALYKLDEISKPYAAYTADVLDLARQYPEKYSALSYWLGDIVTLVSRRSRERVEQRIKKLVMYMHEPEKNTCEISNTKLDFVDIQKEAEEAAETLTSVIGTDGTITADALLESITELTGTIIDGGSATTQESIEIDNGDADSDELIIIDGGNAYN